ncbi:hypothetical protein L0337_30845 [candidate division KSB1 bacterium]|nr:hypothetical protein [candidate division KSB1 bacterium]
MGKVRRVEACKIMWIVYAIGVAALGIAFLSANAAGSRLLKMAKNPLPVRPPSEFKKIWR